MKISFDHPVTSKRTSITINDSMIRLHAVAHDYDVSSDDFMYDTRYRAELQDCITRLAKTYAVGNSNFSTFISYVENTITIDAISFINELKKL